jgi:hypothetical protein
MVAWAFSGSCQKSGALIFSSSAANCGSIAEASKIAPHQLDAFLELGVALLQVFDVLGHVGILHSVAGIRKSKWSSPDTRGEW